VFAADATGQRPWHPQTVSRHFAKLCERAGLDGARLHDLRHFVVSYLLDAGVDLATVKALVGHAAMSRTTLDVYSHTRDEKKRNATGILARLLDLSAPTPPPDDDPTVVNLADRRGA
jgi:site-specific recombinase XerD